MNRASKKNNFVYTRAIFSSVTVDNSIDDQVVDVLDKEKALYKIRLLSGDILWVRSNELRFV